MNPSRMIARNLEADLGHRRTEGCRERVRGRDARDADDDGADEADRPGAQALLGEAAGVVRRTWARVAPQRRGERSSLTLLLWRASVRGTTTIGTGSSCSIFAAVEPRKSRRGWARRLEPTTASSPGSQLSWETASSMLSPRATTTSASTPSGSCASAFESTSSACAAPAMRMTPVSTRRRKVDRDEREQAQLGAGRCGERRARVEQRIGARPGSDRRRDARDARGRVDAPRALGREHDGQLRGVEQLAGDGSEPVTAAQPAVGGADDDVRSADLGCGIRQVLRRRSRRSGCACARSRHPPPAPPPE